MTQEELERLEAELETLAVTLDGDIQAGTFLGVYAVALARRCCSLWVGVRLMCRDLHLTAAAATLRPALEALILIGWLAADPEDRLVRWHGESERSVRVMVEGRHDYNEARAARLVARVPEERSAEREAAIAAARGRVAPASAWCRQLRRWRLKRTVDRRSGRHTNTRIASSRPGSTTITRPCTRRKSVPASSLSRTQRSISSRFVHSGHRSLPRYW